MLICFAFESLQYDYSALICLIHKLEYLIPYETVKLIVFTFSTINQKTKICENFKKKVFKTSGGFLTLKI